jgi:hypothetical protein
VEGSHDPPDKGGRTRKVERAQHGQVRNLLFGLICILGRSAAGAELNCQWGNLGAPCHRVGPMVDRWVAEHPDLRIVKLDYDTHKADRERFGLRGVPMLVLLDGDKVIAKYGQNAQKVADFASDAWNGCSNRRAGRSNAAAMIAGRGRRPCPPSWRRRPAAA